MSKDPQELRRVMASSMIGTVIEWYDFFLFGIGAALVFPHVFFPAGNDTAATLGSFATFGVAFVARPFGAALFGHYGDRLGRKVSLVATLLLMGIATFAIGLIPSYDSIGLWAPALLAIARICQGIALGGEWGGAALIAVEHAPPGRRGFYGAFPQIGNPIGFFLANGVMQAVIFFTSQTAFLTWAWRIGFLLSGVLVLVGMYIRLNVSDSPVFLEAQKKQEAQEATKIPLVELFRNHPRVLLLTVLLQGSFALGGYGLIVYSGTYAQKSVGMPSSWFLLAGMAGSLVAIPMYGLLSHLSDKVGRKPIYAVGILSYGILGFPFFWLISGGTFAGIAVAFIMIWGLGHAGAFSVQSSFLSELFPTEVRYTAVSMSYQLSSVVFAAPTAAVVAWLFISTGTIYSVAALVLGVSLISLIALFLLPETRHQSLSDVDVESETEVAAVQPV